MNVYSITNIPEMRSMFAFNRISNEISEITRRLETGQRINTGKDDPAGLIARDSMRLDIKGIQAAQRTTSAANELLSAAESGLANVSRMLIGDINDRDNNGLIGLIYDDTMPADMKQQHINDILNMIDGTVQSTTYNGKQLLTGSMDYRPDGSGGLLFQLGKDVQTTSQYRMALPSMTVNHLGGASGVLNDLRTIDLETDAGRAQAYAIVTEAVNQVAMQRGTIGAVQKGVLQSNADNLDVQLASVSESEALISNADMALESSRLSRAEILAQSAMNSILYSRQFGQFILTSLLG